MDLNNVFGLPAHPLLVHLPLVAIPVLALAAIAMAARPAWRARLAVPVAAAGLVVLGFTVLAAGAGESLQERVPDTALVREHADLGGQLKLIVIGLAVVLVLVALAERLRERRPTLAAALPPLAILAAVAGIAATVWDVRAGHAGSKAVWHDTPRTAQHGGGEG